MFKVRSRKPVAGGLANPKVCEAVRENKLVRCIYIGGDVRIVQPHCHGHSHTGHEVLSAFQISGEGEGWKMFDVAKFISFEIQNETFVRREDYHPERPGFTQVHCSCATQQKDNDQ